MNHKCDKCREQDRREGPRGWKLFKRLAVGFWRKYILRRKPVQPDPKIKTYNLPRFYCAKCEKFVDIVIPLATTELGIPAIVACHKQADYKTVSLVAMMIDSIQNCHWTVFTKNWRRNDSRIPPEILQGMKELEACL